MTDPPQVEPQEKAKVPKGRALKRLKYTRRFVNVTLTGGGKRKVSEDDRCAGANEVLTAVTDEPQPRLVNGWGDEDDGYMMFGRIGSRS